MHITFCTEYIGGAYIKSGLHLKCLSKNSRILGMSPKKSHQGLLLNSLSEAFGSFTPRRSSHYLNSVHSSPNIWCCTYFGIHSFYEFLVLLHVKSLLKQLDKNVKFFLLSCLTKHSNCIAENLALLFCPHPLPHEQYWCEAFITRYEKNQFGCGFCTATVGNE